MEDKNQKLTGYSDNKGVSYITMHMKKYRLLMDSFIPGKLSVWRKLLIGIDFAFCVIVYGAGINDYFQYQFYRRRANDRKNFIVGRKWIQTIKACNGEVKNSKFDDKGEFNEIFKEYLCRDWLDLDNCSEGEFADFSKKHPNCIYKVKNGSGGNGIRKVEIDLNRLGEEYSNYKNGGAVLEELIIQNKELQEFNPSSVNTIRVVTILTREGVKVMNAVFRTGNGTGSTDNFHHYGLAMLVDVETGIVISNAVDKKNQKFIIHPKSGKQLIGYTLPCWDKILDTVKKAALEVPEVRYVGWDIALTDDDKVCIIEGNCASDPDIVQMTDQIGKWPLYKEQLKLL